MPTSYAKRSVRKGAGFSGETNGDDAFGPSWVKNLNQAIDDLNVSRTSTREEALATIVKTLSMHYAALPLASRAEELLILLRRSLSKGSSVKETCMASHAISLVFLNFADDTLVDQDQLYQRMIPALKSTLQNHDDHNAKSTCLQTIALITLLNASDIDSQLMRDYVFDLIETNGDECNTDAFSSSQLDAFMAAALQAYGVLFAASFSRGKVDTEVVWEELEKVIPMHEILLESADKEVRVAAGENVAIVFETLRASARKAKEDVDEEDTEQYTFDYDNMDGLIHTLKELSVDGSHWRSKSDRVEQRSVFRDIVKSVDQDVPPLVELKIAGQVAAFSGWSKILLLQAFRRCLGQGLQEHLITNERLRHLFHTQRFVVTSFASANSDDEIDYSELSKVDKRYLYDESKKARSIKLREARMRKGED